MPRPSRKIAIMQAAARLFAAKGYNAVSVRDIAAEMELTPASLYYYFPDKETLYRQTLVMVFTGVQSAFKAPQGTTGIEKDEGVFPVDIQQAGQSHDRDPRSHQPQYCRQQETTHHLFLLQRARIPRKSIPASSRASASASRAGEIAENMG